MASCCPSLTLTVTALMADSTSWAVRGRRLIPVVAMLGGALGGGILIRLVNGASATPSEPAAPLTSSTTTTVLVPVTQPATVALLRWDVPITDVRALSAALFLLALALGAWAARGRATDPQTTLGHRLVRAHNIDLAGRTVVDVDPVDVLVKLCDLYSTVALHASTDSHDLFVVIADQTVYRLATPIASKRAPSRATHQARPGQPAARH